LVLLGIARPAWHTLFDRAQWGRVARRGFGLAAGAAAAGAGLIGLAALSFGSTDAALAQLRGERISIRPSFLDVGGGQPGQTLETAVEAVNRTDRPVRMIGGSSDCSCVVTADLPLTLGPGEARRVSVQVHLPASSGLFQRKAFFWTDCDEARSVVFGLTGRVDPPGRDPAAVTEE
jgi:hypothetical protein